MSGRRITRRLGVDDISQLPTAAYGTATAHLYLRVPSVLLPDGLRVRHAHIVQGHLQAACIFLVEPGPAWEV